MNQQKVSVGTVSFSVISGLIASLSLNACVGDKSIDDWRRDRVNQQLAQQNKAVGIFTGTMNSTQDHLSLGKVTLSLQSDTNVKDSYNNLGSEPQAVLRGSLTYSGVTNAVMPFQQASYDETTGIFSAAVQIKDNSGTPVSLTLKGVISGDQFTGTLYAQGYEAYSANFVAVRNANTQPVTAKTATSARAKMIAIAANQDFVGGSDDLPVKMTLLYGQLKPDAIFLNIFLPTTALQVKLNFLGTTPEEDQLVLFDSANLDEATNQLRAQTTEQDSASGVKYQLHMECTRTLSGSQTAYWDCVATMGNGRVFTLHLTPAK